MWQKKQYWRVCECACLQRGSERDVLLDSIHPTSQSVVYLEGCDGILSFICADKDAGHACFGDVLHTALQPLTESSK